MVAVVESELPRSTGRFAAHTEAEAASARTTATTVATVHRRLIITCAPVAPYQAEFNRTNRVALSLVWDKLVAVGDTRLMRRRRTPTSQGRNDRDPLSLP